MKRMLRAPMLLGAIALFFASLHAAGATPDGGAGNPPTWPICPGCDGLKKLRTERSIGKGQDVRHLKTVACGLAQSDIRSGKVEILSRSGKRLFVSSKVSVKIVESTAVVELSERSAKAAERYFKPGNTLVITLNIAQHAPARNDKGDKHK